MGWVGIKTNARIDIEIEIEGEVYRGNKREELQSTLERVEIYVEGERQRDRVESA